MGIRRSNVPAGRLRWRTDADAAAAGLGLRGPGRGGVRGSGGQSGVARPVALLRRRGRRGELPVFVIPRGLVPGLVLSFRHRDNAERPDDRRGVQARHGGDLLPLVLACRGRRCLRGGGVAGVLHREGLGEARGRWLERGVGGARGLRQGLAGSTFQNGTANGSGGAERGRSLGRPHVVWLLAPVGSLLGSHLSRTMGVRHHRRTAGGWTVSTAVRSRA